MASTMAASAFPEGGWAAIIAMSIMATKSDESKTPTLREAHRELRLALDECQALLKRTEEMLRRSQQDNEPRFSD